jgi:hypothetical protein
MYNKQIGTVSVAPYPILLKSTLHYFDSLKKDPSISLMNKDFIFLAAESQTDHDTLSPLRVNSFSPNKISVSMASSLTGQVVYQQNYYPHWFYNDGHVKKNVLPYGISFFSAPVTNGTGNMEFTFEPRIVKYGMVITFLALGVVVILILFLSFTGTTKQINI